MRVIPHTRIAYDMIHRDLEKKPDSFNQQIGNRQNQHTGKEQFRAVFHAGSLTLLRIILQVHILLLK